MLAPLPAQRPKWQQIGSTGSRLAADWHRSGGDEQLCCDLRAPSVSVRTAEPLRKPVLYPTELREQGILPIGGSRLAARVVVTACLTEGYHIGCGGSDEEA